jgi:hypothetical protein
MVHLMVLVLAYYDYGLGTISNGPIEVQLGNPLGQVWNMCDSESIFVKKKEKQKGIC